MAEKERIMSEYYFQIEIEQGAYIWSHYQCNTRNFDYDIQLNDIVEEQGKVIGIKYGGVMFSLDEEQDKEFCLDKREFEKVFGYMKEENYMGMEKSK